MYNAMYYYMDGTYILVIIGALLTIIASARVKSTYSKYARVRSGSGMTGAEVAQKILRGAGIYDVSVQRIAGKLTDHYDAKGKALRLSEAVYDSDSVAAIGVAAHECGHAIQHNTEYQPLKLRSALVPAANIGSKIGIPIIILGLILGSSQFLITIGIWVFSIAVLFQVVTLPVEFNASRRALVILGDTRILSETELKYSEKVLRAAALTYVAAAAASILQLLRLVMLFGGGRRRD